MQAICTSLILAEHKFSAEYTVFKPNWIDCNMPGRVWVDLSPHNSGKKHALLSVSKLENFSSQANSEYTTLILCRNTSIGRMGWSDLGTIPQLFSTIFLIERALLFPLFCRLSSFSFASSREGAVQLWQELWETVSTMVSSYSQMTSPGGPNTVGSCPHRKQNGYVDYSHSKTSLVPGHSMTSW